MYTSLATLAIHQHPHPSLHPWLYFSELQVVINHEMIHVWSPTPADNKVWFIPAKLMFSPFRVQRRFKMLIFILLIPSTLSAFWFAISVYGYTSTNAVNLFVTLCFQYFCALSTTSLYLEAAVEVTYPIPEGKLSFWHKVKLCQKN